MTIFRYKKDGKLYKIYEVIRSTCLCSWKRYQAQPLYHDGRFVTMSTLKDFEVVAHK